ncbi:MAG TPA: hypothetical protein VEI97_00250, partial [bacterium]|nr:hypothetical protein [bacterium]
MSATPVRLRPCLILAALVALPITPLLAGGDTGGAAAPAAGGTETQPVATTEPAAAPAADADLTSTFDIEGQWVYFTMFPKTDDNVDRD